MKREGLSSFTLAHTDLQYLCPLPALGSSGLGLSIGEGHLLLAVSLPALQLLPRPVWTAQFTGRGRWRQGFRPAQRGHLYRFAQKLHLASPGS